MINIDDELSTISIYENSSLTYFKTFSFGTNSVYRDLSQLCSLKESDVRLILSELSFNGELKNKKTYIDQKFFKDSQFTKLSLSHFKDIINSRVEEMMNYLFNKNSNLNYFKNKLSHVYLVFENKIFYNNLGETFTRYLNYNSDKNYFQNEALDDLPLFGAAELTFKGWHAEALPIVEKKKSLFGGVFSRFFSIISACSLL